MLTQSTNNSTHYIYVDQFNNLSFFLLCKITSNLVSNKHGNSKNDKN